MSQPLPKPLPQYLLRLITSEAIPLSEMTHSQRWRLYSKLKQEIIMSDDVRTPLEYDRRIREVIDYLGL